MLIPTQLENWCEKNPTTRAKIDEMLTAASNLGALQHVKDAYTSNRVGPGNTYVKNWTPKT